MSRDDDGVWWHIVAAVRALLPDDWQGNAGKAFRNTLNSMGKYASEHHVTPKEVLDDGVEGVKTKFRGIMTKEYADAQKSFAEAEKIKMETKLMEGMYKATVRREEAEAGSAELTFLKSKVELYEKLSQIGVRAYGTTDANITVLPSEGFVWPIAEPLRILLESIAYLHQSNSPENQAAVAFLLEHLRNRF